MTHVVRTLTSDKHKLQSFEYMPVVESMNIILHVLYANGHIKKKGQIEIINKTEMLRK